MTERGMIQEMAKDYNLCYPCERFVGYIDDSGSLTNYTSDCYCLEGLNPCKCGISCDLAKHLISLGYRKVPEGAVVLSQSEIDEFRKDQAEVKFLKRQIIDLARKETAQEIFALIDSYCESIKALLVEGGLYNAGSAVDIICRRIKTMIVETYGVEVVE